MKNLDESYFVIVAGTISIGIIGLTSLYHIVNNNISSKSRSEYLTVKKIEPEYYKKFYDIVVKESGLDTDLYNRKPSSKVIKLLCKIAKKSGIKITDQIDKKTFDELYIKLVKTQYNIAKKNNLI